MLIQNIVVGSKVVSKKSNFVNIEFAEQCDVIPIISVLEYLPRPLPIEDQRYDMPQTTESVKSRNIHDQSRDFLFSLPSLLMKNSGSAIW